MLTEDKWHLQSHFIPKKLQNPNESLLFLTLHSVPFQMHHKNLTFPLVVSRCYQNDFRGHSTVCKSSLKTAAVRVQEERLFLSLCSFLTSSPPVALLNTGGHGRLDAWGVHVDGGSGIKKRDHPSLPQCISEAILVNAAVTKHPEVSLFITKVYQSDTVRDFVQRTGLLPSCNSTILEFLFSRYKQEGKKHVCSWVKGCGVWSHDQLFFSVLGFLTSTAIESWDCLQ